MATYEYRIRLTTDSLISMSLALDTALEKFNAETGFAPGSHIDRLHQLKKLVDDLRLGRHNTRGELFYPQGKTSNEVPYLVNAAEIMRQRIECVS